MGLINPVISARTKRGKEVECPRSNCKAPVGELCRTATGNKIYTVHAKRYTVANEARRNKVKDLDQSDVEADAARMEDEMDELNAELVRGTRYTFWCPKHDVHYQGQPEFVSSYAGGFGFYIDMSEMYCPGNQAEEDEACPAVIRTETVL